MIAGHSSYKYWLHTLQYLTALFNQNWTKCNIAFSLKCIQMYPTGVRCNCESLFSSAVTEPNSFSSYVLMVTFKTSIYFKSGNK